MSERICLIVDDDPAIRTYLKRILDEEHLQSLEAETAEEGMRIVQRLNGNLDLVVSDITMPGDMDGMDLACAIRLTYPSVSVILISGYAENLRSVSAAGFEVIRKPFVPGTILNAARKAMGLDSDKRAPALPSTVTTSSQ
jgi:DNA-binding NtrC family response regulator